jgi:hypothetical protein
MSDTTRAKRKEAIVVLDYEGDTDESMSKLRIEASNIAKRLEGKGRKVYLNKTQQEFETCMKSPDSKGIVKIHIVAHGNQEQCGNFNPIRLADWLRFRIKDKPALKYITIHSCCSGSVHPTSNLIFVQQFASHLLSHMSGRAADHYGGYLVVRGSDGESYTDSEGHNWVLKDGTTIPKYKTRERESVFLNANTKPRNTARPKFAISNTPEYKGVAKL